MALYIVCTGTGSGIINSGRMSHIQAIFRRGVFEPLEPVDLPEEQRVELSVGVISGQNPQAWLREVSELQSDIVRRHGALPDSSSEIAADRQR